MKIVGVCSIAKRLFKEVYQYISHHLSSLPLDAHPAAKVEEAGQYNFHYFEYNYFLCFTQAVALFYFLIQQHFHGLIQIRSGQCLAGFSGVILIGFSLYYMIHSQFMRKFIDFYSQFHLHDSNSDSFYTYKYVRIQIVSLMLS